MDKNIVALSPHIVHYSLGELPPPDMLASVAVASMPHQSTVWTTPTCTPSVAWASASTSLPPPSSHVTLTPTSSWTQPHGHQQHLLPSSEQASGGLILSPAGEVLPRKLVEKIQSRQFVEMKELLFDNISLLQQLEATQGQVAIQTVGAARPRLREVTSITTWCYCFLGYLAVLTTDAVTRDQLVYARLLIREAQRHGGQAWLDYDRAFRQQAAADPATSWNTINPGLQAATILTQRLSGQTTFCTLCRMVDHVRSQCALQFLEPASTTIPSQRPAPPVAARRARPQICYSWNLGSCAFPGRCTFRHVCSSCTSATHRAPDCPRSQSNP